MKKKINILAINYLGHDSSAAIMQNGKIIAACEQERYTRDKHSRLFPIDAINDCLKIAKIKIEDINEIAFCDRAFYTIIEMYIKPFLKDKSKIKLIKRDIKKIKNFIFVEELLRKKLKYNGKVNFYSHHLCHLAGAYYPSGFDKSLIFSFDGIGDNVSSHFALGNNGKINLIHDGSKFPESLGLFYSGITDYLGWRHHCDEGIVMGLAAYGDANSKVSKKKKTYIQYMRDIIKSKNNFDIEIDKKYITYHYEKNTWVSKNFLKIFGPRRKYGEVVTDRHKNIAAALQKRIEEIILLQLKIAKKKFKVNKLCLSGGIGLNCVLNGKIESSNLFKEIFIQPAAGDNGLVIGGCYLSYKNFNNKIKLKKDWNVYLGSEFSDNEILKSIKKHKIKYLKPKDIFLETAKELKKGRIAAWFQGRAEFGPRALGNRSILSKPYPYSVKDYVNNKVKFREYFRPLAPAVLEEKKEKYFNLKQDSPHMLIACKGKKKSNDISATIHYDNTARVQTVSKNSKIKFRKLIETFYKITSCPVLLNTSFNIKGEPIVNTPDQAIKCFLKTNIDILTIGNFFIRKNNI